MKLRWFLAWLVASMAIFLPLLLDVPVLVTIFAVNSQALLWLMGAMVTGAWVCMSVGWQRREFPTQVLLAIVGILVVWVLIPNMWSGVMKPLITIRTMQPVGVLWLVWMLVVIGLAFVWLGWRLRRTADVLRRRNRITQITQTQLNEGVALLDKRQKILWANQSAEDYLKRLKSETQRLFDRAHESKRIQTQNFALGEGERVNVQVIPQIDGTTTVLMRTLQNYADATQFYEHFIRRLVHDMRNPLAAIIAHASNLHSTQLLPDPSNYQRTAQTIENEAQRLTRLVDSMLFDARLSYVPLAMQAVDLRDVVEDVLFQHDERAIKENKSIAMQVPAKPMMFEADRDLLTRALSNLVDNSLKYSSAGCVVTMTLEDDGTHYVLRIKDTGDGIADDVLPDRIFEPLVRGQKGQGSGLGLAIVKKIVEMHNGVIRVGSRVGVGTEMVIWLPK
jgi:signal transduction histidine kinase